MEKKEKTKETSRIRRCTSCKYTINQTSSEISGKLPDDYRQHIGDILAAQKGDCDEIIIIKNGLVTGTSFTNIAIYKDGKWITPKHPLLLGTKRAALLEKGIIQEADITVDDLMKAG